jgi:hypothetical protein
MIKVTLETILTATDSDKANLKQCEEKDKYIFEI